MPQRSAHVERPSQLNDWKADRLSLLPSPSSPCTAVVDALQTGLPKIVFDAAGLMHVAVPLLLGGHALGAILRAKCPANIPSHSFCRKSRKHLECRRSCFGALNKQYPVTRASLRSAEGPAAHAWPGVRAATVRNAA